MGTVHDPVEAQSPFHLQMALEDAIKEFKQLADVLHAAVYDNGGGPPWLHLMDKHAHDIDAAWDAWAAARLAERNASA